MGTDCAAHMALPMPTHVDAHANAMLCPCPIVPIIPGLPAVVVEQARQGELDSGDDHGKGRGGHRRLPLSPSWLPGRALFIKLNIGIDLDNLTT